MAVDGASRVVRARVSQVEGFFLCSHLLRGADAEIITTVRGETFAVGIPHIQTTKYSRGRSELFNVNNT